MPEPLTPEQRALGLLVGVDDIPRPWVCYVTAMRDHGPKGTTILVAGAYGGETIVKSRCRGSQVERRFREGDDSDEWAELLCADVEALGGWP